MAKGFTVKAKSPLTVYRMMYNEFVITTYYGERIYS